MRLFSVFSALVAVAPFTSAGSAYIYNKCDFDVYLWSVCNDYTQMEPTVLEANIGNYSEPYQTPSSGGVSIKISADDANSNPITQLEYTLNDDGLWYDISNVDCYQTECPFQADGMYLESGHGCPTVSCQGGDLICQGVYTNWDDDHATCYCDGSADLAFYLCVEENPTSDAVKRNVGSFVGRPRNIRPYRRHLHS